MRDQGRSEKLSDYSFDIDRARGDTVNGAERPSRAVHVVEAAVVSSGSEPSAARKDGAMASGTVKWFNDAKGFGFIRSDDGVDVFVHHTSIVADGHRTLREGERVQFEITDGPKGPKAQNVKQAEEE